MNTVAHNVVAKLSVAFVAVAMLFMLVSPAKAATAEEMQQMINDLLAQVAALQGSLGGSSSAAAMCPYTWTRTLTVGATGADVMKLQQFLNSDADTRVSASGVGSAGMETEYFGPATAAAVSKLQVKYRADILSPAGLVNPTGTFGPATMAKANALCVKASTGDDTSDDSSDDSDDTSSDLSGEASFDHLDVEDGDDTELEEGQEDAPVADAKVEFSDGDAMITRMDVQLTDGAGNDEVDPWNTFDTVTLWVDGDMVAEMDASDKDSYLGDEDNGILRFSGLDIVANEDDEMTITIGVSVQSSVEGAADGEDWDVTVDSLRFIDGDEVTSTENSPTADSVTFSINAEGADDELIVKTSSEDPDGTTLTVNDDKKSDWYTVFAFDLDTDDSVNDIELNDVVVTVETPGTSTYAGLVNDAELVIDGTTISDVTFSGKTTNVATLTFNVDGDVTIDAGDRVTAELKLRFNSLATGDEGATVQGKVTSVNADAIDATGADDLDPATQISGAATGDVHTLRTQGIDVDATDTSAAVTVNDGATDDYAVYTIDFDVTAFEQEVYISVDQATSTDWSLETSSGAAVAAGSRTATLSSTADEQNGFYVINDGETETFTLEVTYVPGAANVAARLQLDGINFSEVEDTTPGQSWTASPEADYRTDVKTIVN